MADEIKSLLKDKEKGVLLDRYFKDILADYIVVNSEESSVQAVSRFLTNGFKNIALITTASLQSQMADRLKGYTKAIKRNGLKLYIKKISYTHAALISEEIERFLRVKPAIDAILFVTNYLAINGLSVIQKTGFKIPKDIAVISFDNHVLFQFYNPPITSITQPVAQISESVNNTLMRKLSNVTSPQSRIEIPTSLILRQSWKRK